MTFDDIVDLAEKAGCDVSAIDWREYQTMWCDSYQLERFAAALIQAGAASRDAEVAKWKAAEHSLSDAYLRLRGLLDAFDTPRGVTAEQVWEHTEGKLIDLISERDQLRAQINKLRAAMQTFVDRVERGEVRSRATHAQFRELLATTPEQSIAEYRNKVIEAFVNEFSRHVGGDGEFWLHELQDFAMKEQP